MSLWSRRKNSRFRSWSFGTSTTIAPENGLLARCATPSTVTSPPINESVTSSDEPDDTLSLRPSVTPFVDAILTEYGLLGEPAVKLYSPVLTFVKVASPSALTGRIDATLPLLFRIAILMGTGTFDSPTTCTFTFTVLAGLPDDMSRSELVELSSISLGSFTCMRGPPNCWTV